MNSTMRRKYYYITTGLVLLPLLIAGLFVLIVNIQAQFRYDKSYFTPEYQEIYDAPGIVAMALEQALRTGNTSLFADLTGLNKKPGPLEPNLNIRLTILLDVDDAGYFKYLYFNVKNYERAPHYIKEVNNRWVVVPQDAYFYLDSGQWLLTFTPLAAIWWLFLIVVGSGIFVFQWAARVRRVLFRMPRI